MAMAKLNMKGKSKSPDKPKAKVDEKKKKFGNEGKKTWSKEKGGKGISASSSSSKASAAAGGGGGGGGDKKRKFDKVKGKSSEEAPSKKDRKYTKPNFELVESLKNQWNKVRVKSTPKPTRDALVTQMVKHMTGHVMQVTLRHDASRIVQSIFQFGTPQQKKIILDELLPRLVETCKTPYGHFVVLKALSTCNDEADQKRMCHALSGHFVSIGTNVIGARTVETLLQLVPARLTRDLRAEFYGSKFKVLLPEPPRNLKDLLDGLENKEVSIMDHMRDLVQKFCDKGLLSFTYVHTLLCEYAVEAARRVTSSPKYMEELVQQLAEAAPKLMSSKAGTKAMCYVATYAGAKEKKRILKSLKGKVLESLLHSAAHLGIMRLVDVTDDTVNVQKSLLEELRTTKQEVKYTATGEPISTPLPPLAALSQNRCGRKLLLRLLAPSRPHLEPDEEEHFAPAANSKKPAEAKRKEHVTYLKGPLVTVLSRHAAELVRDKNAAKVLEEVMVTLNPAQLRKALANVFAGKDVEQNQDFEDEEEEGGDDDDEDEEEEEGEEEEGEENEGDEEEEDGEGEGEDMDEANSDDDDSKDKTTAPPAPPSQPKVVLPIQEDPVAHGLLKRILMLEAAAYALKHPTPPQSTSSKKSKSTTATPSSSASSTEIPPHFANLDTSLWEETTGDDDDAESSFSLHLLQLLEEDGKLTDWVTQNRPCFALMELAKVPAARNKLKSLLSKSDLKAALTKTAKSSKGAEMLLQFVCDKK